MNTQNNPPEPEKKLTGKQLQAVALLVNGNTIDATAKQVKVCEKTVDVWKRNPAFKAAMRQAEDDIYNDSLKLLKKTARAAIMTLVACMDPKTSDYVRVNAASKLLDAALEVHKIQELEQEVADLKLLLEAMKT